MATIARPNANAIPSTSIAVGPVPIPAITAAPHPKKDKRERADELGE
jgi:hypothetical protein